jgi:hypothetical protein
VIAVLALLASQNRFGYTLTWQSLRAAVPVLTIGGLIAVHRKWSTFVDQRVPQRVVLLLATAAMCSLVQYPFSAPVYFTYVAPLVIVAAVSLIVAADLLPRPILWILVVFYLLFGVVRLNGSSMFDVGVRYDRGEPIRKLELTRGGLEVPASTALEYERLVGLVQRHAGGSQYMYAAPDAPEVYFLSGLKNPTKTLFEFLDPRPTGVPQLMQALARYRVNVVAINLHPPVSAPPPPVLRAALQARYPDAVLVGQFEVWGRAAPPRS